ncbi:MAG: ABC transporter ATP-binding protein [Chloroflexota bacterium]|nr:MAG: ABC transporter ATP-binding protein [Chloroflexota bacterium]
MKSKDLTLYQKLLLQARPHWKYILGIFLIDLLETPLTLLVPIPLKIAVDNVLGDERLPEFIYDIFPVAGRSDLAILLLAAILLVLIAILTGLQSLGSSLLRTYTGEKLVLDFRTKLFQHVQRLSLSYHDSKGTSDSTYRIQYDTSAIQYIAIDGVIPFITASITLFAMLYVIFRLDARLAFVALAISPILFVITRLYRKNLRQQSRQVKRLESAALSVVQEVLTSLRVVKAFGQEQREQERFTHQSSEGMRARMHYELSSGLLGLLLGATTAFGTAAVLLLGVSHVLGGILTLGSLLLIMGYIAQFYSPLKTISKKIASLQSHLASAERAYDLMEQPPDVVEKPDAEPIQRSKGAVLFQNVFFSYQQDQAVLEDISFEVPPGTRVGIAGQTGAGKSTLVNLLTRFYDPTSGQILLDGVDLRDYRVTDLRNQFAIVLQEPVLFSTSIAENIAYAKPGANEEEIIKAAQAANAHEFITALPDGYESQVGERGMRLSGGERQRIALARAFLKDAPILIMDEPTSSVDVKTEIGIMEAMNRLMENRTTFMIAHRLTTLENCNLLLVIENGRLANLEQDVPAAIKEELALDRLEAAMMRNN